jgi:ribonuclease G
MGSPKNRATVEEALKNELERDRTKTYVVEISPLGLVEMTRQNVTEGPREILTQKCPTCAGDGIVLSTHSAAIDAERRLRTLAAGSKRGLEAYRVEMEENVASHVIGPGALRLAEIERLSKRRFFIEGKAGVPLDHFKVDAEGKLVDLAPKAPVAEGAEIRIELVEIGRHDVNAGVGKLDGLPVSVADASKLVGKKVKARVERVLDGVAYATLVQAATAKVEAPITAESEAEKPTRAVRKKTTDPKIAVPKIEAPASGVEKEQEPVAEAAEETVEAVAKEESPAEEPAAEAKPGAEGTPDGAAPPKKRTRRGSRGGRNRRKKPAAAVAAENGEPPAEQVPKPEPQPEPQRQRQPKPKPERAPTATIHVPSADLGTDGDNTSAAEGEQPTPKKRTRRGSRGGRNRRRKPAGAGAAASETKPSEPSSG